MNFTDAPLSSASPAPNDPEQDAPENRVCVSAIADKTEWRLRMLEECAEVGMDILREVRRRALAQDDLPPTMAAEVVVPEGDLGLVYPRIQRAIRQVLALHAKFEEDFRMRERETAEEATARIAAAEARRAAASVQPVDLDTERQKRIVRRAVAKAIDKRGRYNDDLFDDLDLRIEEFDDYSDDGQRPVGAIVEHICKVIGVRFDPLLWEHEPWAIREIDTKPTGSPYADWPKLEDWPDIDPEQGNEDDEYGLDEARSSGTGPPHAAE